MDQANAEKLAEALLAWLTFQILCGRQALLSEAYLAQPIAEFLTPIFPDRIHLEWTSPQYRVKARGRPRQLDYVLLSRDASHPVSAIEAKWADGSPPKQRLVDDVLRLEMVRIESTPGHVRHTRRYFLLAGLLNDVLTYLNASVRDGGEFPFFPMFLPSLNDQPHTVPVRKAPSAIQPFFRDFALAYKQQLPTSYKTHRIADRSSGHARVIIWEIQSTKRRTLFDPAVTWQELQVTPAEEDDAA